MRSMHRRPIAARATLRFAALLLAVIATAPRGASAGALAAPAPAAVTPVPASPPSPGVLSAPAMPHSPVSAIRNKLSAGDLASAESIEETWAREHGTDDGWIAGYAWLARGALMLADRDVALRYADSTRARVAARLAAGADLAENADLETALGAAIEVHAQVARLQCCRDEAVKYLRYELTSVTAPPALVMRLHKRLDLLDLPGRDAPELVVDALVHGSAPSLAALRGRPVVLFLWSPYCGDCKGSAAMLESVAKRHAHDGLAFVAVSSWHHDADEHALEVHESDSTWTAVYSGLGAASVIVSEPSSITYGASSTPTFVFIDRRGKVKGYVPTRLTEAAFERELAAILR